MSEASPPERPPMMSPDGRWVWDGRQWQPVAGKHEGVFPTFATVRVDPAASAEAAEPSVQMASPPGFQGPPVEYTMDAPADASTDVSAPYIPDAADATPLVPLWERPQKGLGRYLYVGAAFMVVVIALVAVNAFFPFASLLPRPAPESSPVPTPPVAQTPRSEFDRAAYFLNKVLVPAVVSMNETSTAQRQLCTGQLTSSCQSALIENDNQLMNVLAVIDKADVPACVAAFVPKLKADLMAMDTAVKAAIKGFTDNKRTAVVQALARYASAAKPLGSDGAALTSATNNQCDTQLTGP